MSEYDNHELMATVELASRYYGTELMKGSGKDRDLMRGYVASRRLYAPMAEAFRIGYAPQSVGGRPWILHKIPDEKLLLAAGILTKTSQGLMDPMEGRLLFPQVNPSGKFVGFVGRSIGKNRKDKYLATGLTPIFRRTESLFRIDKARPFIESNGYAIVVEGLLDSALLFQVGVRNVVATGTKAMTDPQAQILARYTSRIEVMFDNDIEGKEGAEELRRRNLRHFAAIDFRAYPPKFKDPAEWVAAELDKAIQRQQAAVLG